MVFQQLQSCQAYAHDRLRSWLSAFLTLDTFRDRVLFFTTRTRHSRMRRQYFKSWRRSTFVRRRRPLPKLCGPSIAIISWPAAIPIRSTLLPSSLWDGWGLTTTALKLTKCSNIAVNKSAKVALPIRALIELPQPRPQQQLCPPSPRERQAPGPDGSPAVRLLCRHFLPAGSLPCTADRTKFTMCSLLVLVPIKLHC